MSYPFTFAQERVEGVDFILLRKVKTSFGDRKHRPSGKYSPRTNGVEPYAAAAQMREFYSTYGEPLVHPNP